MPDTDEHPKPGDTPADGPGAPGDTATAPRDTATAPADAGRPTPRRGPCARWRTPYDLPETPESTPDDERGPMTPEERGVWVYGIVAPLTAVIYLAIVVPRLIGHDPAEVSWVAPMLWMIGVAIVGSILGTILSTIGAAIGLAVRGRDPEEAGARPDERDRAIKSYGDRKTQSIVAFGTIGALILAMIDADGFWIGSFLFLNGTIAAVVEAVVKIRAYRRGF
jgi:hypothetical protein